MASICTSAVSADADDDAGISTGAIIGIVIIILIIILILVDITCYFRNQCGAIYFLHGLICKRGEEGATGGGKEPAGAVEERDAEKNVPLLTGEAKEAADGQVQVRINDEGEEAMEEKEPEDKEETIELQAEEMQDVEAQHSELQVVITEAEDPPVAMAHVNDGAAEIIDPTASDGAADTGTKGEQPQQETAT